MFWLDEPEGDAEEGNATVVRFYYLVNPGESIDFQGGGSGDVVDDHLHYLTLFLDAGEGWYETVDGILKLFSGHEECRRWWS